MPPRRRSASRSTILTSRCRTLCPVQVIGRSRFGWIKKVHGLTGIVGRFMPRHAGRTRTGWNADRLGRLVFATCVNPFGPGRTNRKRVIRYHKQRHLERFPIEDVLATQGFSSNPRVAATTSPPIPPRRGGRYSCRLLFWPSRNP